MPGSQAKNRIAAAGGVGDWVGYAVVKINIECRAWWLMPVIPALGRLRQEDRCEFETSLGYRSELKASIARPCLKKTKKRRS